jgi:hypothetical protein
MTITNRLLKALKCCLALLIVGLFVPSFANASEVTTNTLAFTNQNLRGADKNYQPVNSWTPYFTWIGNVQNHKMSTFTQATMGVGFLYVSNFKGNLIMTPQGGNQNDNGTILPRGIGKINYNRTPVLEWMYGYKVFTWLSVLFSIQNQNNVSVQTEYVRGGKRSTPQGSPWGDNADNIYYQFRSQLGLNTLMLKVNFELPWVLVWKNWMHAAYLGLGVGPSWQSWTDNRVYAQYYFSNTGGGRDTFVNTLAQKYSTNCAFQVDAGVRMKPAVVSADISVLWGVKFNEYGQMRSIGKLTQQGAWNQGLFKPVSARVLYSFAPYLGFQWNF